MSDLEKLYKVHINRKYFDDIRTCRIVLPAWIGEKKKNNYVLVIVKSDPTPYDTDVLIPKVQEELKVCDEAIAYYSKKISEWEENERLKKPKFDEQNAQKSGFSGKIET
jgi:hypothetical protein